ncbi:TorF family putative porin [Paraglaciecola sp.]|uniref:TorF family putative porin n=1 Tax=Paraglaciecola sp. TaxID=1920173 RepID=UPI0030F43C27
MKTLKLGLVGAAVLAASGFSQFAAAQVSANFGATSNYLWRGASQSGDSASVSGGIDYVDESGFYAGTWVGSLGEGSGAEADFYLGLGGEAGGFGYDVGYIYYNYPDLDDADFGEVYVNGSVGDLSFGFAYTVNSQGSDPAAFVEGDMYVSAGYSFTLPNEFGLSLTVGQYMFENDGVEADLDYTHVQADISKGDFSFSVSKATDAIDDDVKFLVSWGTSF